MELDFLEGLRDLLAGRVTFLEAHQRPRERFQLPCAPNPHKGMPSGEDISKAYAALTEELGTARDTGDALSRIQRCWGAIDAETTEDLRSSPHFEALIATCYEVSTRLSDRRVALAKSRVDEFLGMLIKLRALQVGEVTRELQVGPFTVEAPGETMRKIEEALAALPEEHAEELEDARKAAQAAYDAIYKPAVAKTEAAIKAGILATIAPLAPALAAKHGWKSEAIEGGIKYSVGTGKGKKEFVLPHAEAEAAATA